MCGFQLLNETDCVHTFLIWKHDLFHHIKNLHHTHACRKLKHLEIDLKKTIIETEISPETTILLLEMSASLMQFGLVIHELFCSSLLRFCATRAANGDVPTQPRAHESSLRRLGGRCHSLWPGFGEDRQRPDSHGRSSGSSGRPGSDAMRIKTDTAAPGRELE